MENRIISQIGVYGSLILSNTSEGKVMPWLWIILAVYWLVFYLKSLSNSKSIKK